MNHDEDFLARIGIRPDQLEAPQIVTWPTSDTGQASALSVAVTLATLMAGVAHTMPLAVEALRQAGVTARAAVDNPRLLEFSVPRGERVELWAEHQAGTASLEDHKDVAYVDAQLSGTFVLRTARGRVVCDPRPGGLQVQVVAEPGPMLGMAPIDAPVREWLSSCSDAWVVEESRPYEQAGDSWSKAVIAGMIARLIEPTESPADRARSLIRSVDSELARPRQWVRGLPADQLLSLQRLAHSEVDRLHEDLEYLLRAIEDERETWPADWVRLCVHRDDLEGVLLLLREAGASANVDLAVETLDHAGRLAWHGVPLGQVPDSERLRRVALRDPDAWWGQPPAGHAA